jgi:hypothetical protein
MPLASYQASKDWRFVDEATVAQNADYQVHGAYPNFGNTNPADLGYWRDDVPNIPECLPTCQEDTLVNCTPFPDAIPEITDFPDNGIAWVTANATIQYIPDNGFTGIDHITILFVGSSTPITITIYVGNSGFVSLNEGEFWVAVSGNAEVIIDSYCSTNIVDCCEDKLAHHSILLGDVNGSWTNASGLRTAAQGMVLFNIDDAITIADNTYKIPVSYQYPEAVYAVDFSLMYNTSHLNILAIESAEQAINDQFSMHYNVADNELRLTSYTLAASSTSETLYYITVSVLDGQSLNAASLGTITAYINGLASEVATSDMVLGVPTTIDMLNGLSIYPNPVLDVATIRVHNYAANVSTTLRLQNAQGKLVKNIVLNAQQSSVDVSDMAAGIYLVSVIQNNEQVAYQKLVKQ